MGASSKIVSGIITVVLFLLAWYAWQSENFGFAAGFVIAGILFLFVTAKA